MIKFLITGGTFDKSYNHVNGELFFKKTHLPSVNTIKVFYEGNPKVAVRPPWDGGLTWTRDSNGKHFVANSNQGIGASIWWPIRPKLLPTTGSL